MKITSLLEVPTVKILLLLLDKGEVRHADLAKVIASRGTLSLSLKELDEDSLIRRRVISSKPIQAYYSLTDRGQSVATYFLKVEGLIAE